MSFWPGVVVATPAHSGVGGILSYRSESPLTPGALVRVPLGSREVLGVVWDCPSTPPEGLSEAQLRGRWQPSEASESRRRALLPDSPPPDWDELMVSPRYMHALSLLP